MSSEIYYTVEVDKHVLHRQLMLQLEQERARQDAYLQSVSRQASSIREQIRNARDSSQNQKAMPAAGIKMSNIHKYDSQEKSFTGFSDEELLSGTDIVNTAEEKDGIQPIDLSRIIEDIEHESDQMKKEAYIRQISEQLAGAAVQTSEAREEKNKFVAYLNKLLQDTELDFAYFKTLVEQRYEPLRALLTLDKQPEVSGDRATYYALCAMLQMQTENVETSALAALNEKLLNLLMERRKNEYVSNTIKEVFEELGMTVTGEIELAGLPGDLVAVDGEPACSIFMSRDKRGILFETVASDEASPAVIEESANRICKKHLEIVRRLRERGILINVSCAVPPKAAQIKKLNMAESRSKVRRKKEKELYIGG